MIRTGDDYRDITYEYLASCARDGALYVELTASPDHAALVGLSDEEHLDGIARGIDDASAEYGIEGRILISACATSAWSRRCAWPAMPPSVPHPYVVGFSMAGDEENYPAGDYAEAFEIAAAAGLGCSVHAGEWAGARQRARGARAAGHAASATACARSRIPRLVGELAERGSCSRCCPTSNVVLGIFPTYEAAPAPGLGRPA